MCIAFGQVRVDRAVSREVLQAIQPLAIEAALEAADQLQRGQHEGTRALQLELEQARYEARLAARRYEAIDPENRLVAGELESRWNRALLRVRELENRVSQAEQKSASAPVVSREDLLALASRRLTKRLGVSLQ